MGDPCLKGDEFARLWGEVRKAVNGKIAWQAAFWVLTVGLVVLGSNMVANDRIRASEDVRISSQVTENSTVATTNKAVIASIDTRLTRIELKLDRALKT